MAIRIFGVGLGYLIIIIIGRTWGPEANGVYALVTQTAMFLSMVAIGGLDLSAVRHLSAVEAQQARVSSGALVGLFALTAALILIPIALLAFGGPTILGWIVDGQFSALAIAALAMTLAARAVTRMVSAVLRTQGFFLIGQSFDIVVIPLLLIGILLAGLVASIDDLLSWMIVTGGASIMLAIGTMLTIHWQRAKGTIAERNVSVRAIMAGALPLWGVTVSATFADWYGLAVVTAQHGLADAGVFRVVMQIAVAFSIISTGLFAVYSPRLGAAQSLGDWDKVARLVRSATWLSAALILPAAIILAIFARPVLAIVGAEFTVGTIWLQIAIAGQFLFAVLGPAGLTLAMTGFARINFMITVTSLTALLILAPLAASQLGPLGVVICISLLLVLRNLASVIFVRTKLGINAFTGRHHL